MAKLLRKSSRFARGSDGVIYNLSTIISGAMTLWHLLSIYLCIISLSLLSSQIITVNNW